jgi:hypothetical protein
MQKHLRNVMEAIGGSKLPAEVADGLQPISVSCVAKSLWSRDNFRLRAPVLARIFAALSAQMTIAKSLDIELKQIQQVRIS